MQLDQILNALLSQVDMTSELARRKAYLDLMAYADEHIAAEDYHEFLSQAAQRLGQERLMKDMLSLSLKAEGNERICIRFDEQEGCQIVGNASGCLYLARAFRALSQAGQPGEHIEFEYQRFPLESSSYPCVLYLEDDAYMDTMAEDGPDMIVEAPLQPRVLDIKDIVGFFITEYIPENLLCTINRIYPVLQCEWLGDGDEVWKREIREDHSRMVVLSFRRDDGQMERIALDLDDEFVGFVTRDDMMALLLRE